MIKFTSCLIVVLILVSSCELRTSSKTRFERGCDIIIPDRYEVIQDEYQDMNQDYAVIFKIKLDSLSQQQLTSSIRKSRYYSDKYYIRSFDQPFKIDSDLRAVWLKSFDGYRFLNKNQSQSFSAIIDTLKHQAEFIESSD